MLTRTQSQIKPPVWAPIDRAHPFARGLAACWLLNETAGRTARDIAGSRRDGTFSGNPSWSAGSFGSSLDFDGADDWIGMGDCLNLGVDDISVLAVLKYSAASQPDNWSGTRIGAVLGKGYLDGAGKGYGLLVETDNRLSWQIRNQATAFAAGSDGALNDNRWHLAVGVCDRDDPAGVRLYLDGLRQGVTANATSLNGIDLSGSRAFAIGSRQEASGTWFWDFAGSVALACVWKRVLSEAEIRRLCRNPFEMLSPRRIAARLQPAGTVVSCAGAIHASSSVRGSLHIPGPVPLAGTVRGSSRLHASLLIRAPRPAFQGRLKTEPAWQLEALFRGRSSDAFALGTALTRGWFWVRRAGYAAIYRGTALHDVDWSRILCVIRPGTLEVTLPSHLTHRPGSTECYVLRRFDARGRQEKTTTASVLLRIDSNGRQALPRPNAATALAAQWIDAGRVRLTWFYCPLDQETAPSRFNLYRAAIPIGSVPCEGQGFHQYDAEAATDGPSAFLVRAESVAGVEGRSAVVSVHPSSDAPPAPPTILVARPV
ncbi:MAG TPA: LamG-like jellyroll fold domain-containing protein [Sedimentisphaerales bacterium]|nr:LamG-like jellyroll fold domain-containing protein [Sedimentisphaerales bacterium]